MTEWERYSSICNSVAVGFPQLSHFFSRPVMGRETAHALGQLMQGRNSTHGSTEPEVRWCWRQPCAPWKWGICQKVRLLRSGRHTGEPYHYILPTGMLLAPGEALHLPGEFFDPFRRLTNFLKTNEDCHLCSQIETEQHKIHLEPVVNRCTNIYSDVFTVVI